MGILRNCLICGQEFRTIQSRIDKGHGIYCSWKCNNKSKMKEKIVRACLKCCKRFTPDPQAVKSGKGKYCSRKCFLSLKNRENVSKWKERFFENILSTENRNDCWEWKGSKDRDGYGKFHSVELNTYRAHKISYIMTYGEVPKGMFVCHKCDNPSCVNPDHLFVGDPNRNVQDRIERKRDMNIRGTKHHKAKIDETIVRSIRKRMDAGESCSVIAKELGMHQSTINAIKHRKCWRHV